VGVVDEDKTGFGEDKAVDDVPAIGVLAEGVCSCPVKTETDEIQANNPQKKPNRLIVIGRRL
jgi:hypothetical protein